MLELRRPHCIIDTKVYKYTLRICNTNFPLQKWSHERALVLRHTYSTRSPFLSLLPRCALYGRCFFFGKRVWFTESHIVLFTQFIVDKLKKIVLYQVKQLNHILLK